VILAEAQRSPGLPATRRRHPRFRRRRSRPHRCLLLPLGLPRLVHCRLYGAAEGCSVAARLARPASVAPREVEPIRWRASCRMLRRRPFRRSTRMPLASGRRTGSGTVRRRPGALRTALAGRYDAHARVVTRTSRRTRACVRSPATSRRSAPVWWRSDPTCWTRPKRSTRLCAVRRATGTPAGSGSSRRRRGTAGPAALGVRAGVPQPARRPGPAGGVPAGRRADRAGLRRRRSDAVRWHGTGVRNLVGERHAGGFGVDDGAALFPPGSRFGVSRRPARRRRHGRVLLYDLTAAATSEVGRPAVPIGYWLGCAPRHGRPARPGRPATAHIPDRARPHGAPLPAFRPSGLRHPQESGRA